MEKCIGLEKVLNKHWEMSKEEFKLNRKTRRFLKFATNGGGYGIGNKGAKPAQGTPQVNPFILPKDTGLSVLSKTFPNNYYQVWDITAWRQACEEAYNMGWLIKFAAMSSWVTQSSTFVRGIKNSLAVAISKVPIFLTDEEGNKDEIWTQEICSKKWFKDLCREVVFAYMEGVVGLNIDPLNNKIYKYPMQDIDPINRMLKAQTYTPLNGESFADNVNLVYIQPFTDQDNFLGWMQPIARSFIMMNQNTINWLIAGKRFAYPIPTIGYPQNDEGLSSDGLTSVNTSKLQAENIIKNADLTNGITYPYTIDSQGNIIKALDINFADSGAKSNAYKTYEDFNQVEEDKIREMIFGGTLTSSGGKYGTKGLGEVHEHSKKDFVQYLADGLIDFLNSKPDFFNKIRAFYKNFPEKDKFTINKAKVWGIEDLKTVSTVLVENGQRLKPEFFSEIGLDPNMIEPTPIVQVKTPTNEQNETKYVIAQPEKKGVLNFFNSKIWK